MMSKRASFVVLALVALSCGVLVAQQANRQPEQLRGPQYYSHEPAVDNRKPDAKSWESYLGKQVQVEGLACGLFDKGVGPYLVMADGAMCYVQGLDDKPTEFDGRIVRAKGTLTKRTYEKSPPTSQGFAESFFVYALDDAKLTKLDKAEWPWLRAAPDRKEASITPKP